MKFELTHTNKALLISIFIEMLIIIMLFQVGFKEKPKEVQYAVNFVDDDFNFDELKQEEKIELPDISKYVHKKYATNRASNALQEEQSHEDFIKQQKQALEDFYKNREPNSDNSIDTRQQEKSKNEIKKEKNFTGNSNIRYFIKNRRGVFITNPLYTCPKYMAGTIVINIIVDKTGKVISAKYNKQKSTATAECLIDSALQAAYDSFFNSDASAPEKQEGYISYTY